MARIDARIVRNDEFRHIARYVIQENRNNEVTV